VAIVDKKGRLFGLINLLDLIVILLVVGVAGLFTYRHFHKAGTAAVEGRDQTIEVEFRVPDVSQFTAAALPVGTPVLESKTGTPLGTITAVRSEPVMLTGADKEYPSEKRINFYFTVRGTGRVTVNGDSLAGIEVRVGKSNFIRTKLYAQELYVTRINENPGQ
jgi:hypothetical protein